MSYNYKYIKYKNKYLKLKNNLKGGRILVESYLDAKFSSIGTFPNTEVYDYLSHIYDNNTIIFRLHNGLYSLKSDIFDFGFLDYNTSDTNVCIMLQKTCELQYVREEIPNPQSAIDGNPTKPNYVKNLQKFINFVQNGYVCGHISRNRGPGVNAINQLNGSLSILLENVPINEFGTLADLFFEANNVDPAIVTKETYEKVGGVLRPTTSTVDFLYQIYRGAGNNNKELVVLFHKDDTYGFNKCSIAVGIGSQGDRYYYDIPKLKLRDRLLRGYIEDYIHKFNTGSPTTKITLGGSEFYHTHISSAITEKNGYNETAYLLTSHMKFEELYNDYNRPQTCMDKNRRNVYTYYSDPRNKNIPYSYYPQAAVNDPQFIDLQRVHSGIILVKNNEIKYYKIKNVDDVYKLNELINPAIVTDPENNIRTPIFLENVGATKLGSLMFNELSDRIYLTMDTGECAFLCNQQQLNSAI
jgi:hypothetical protein